jgi:hypothetical protein
MAHAKTQRRNRQDSIAPPLQYSNPAESGSIRPNPAWEEPRNVRMAHAKTQRRNRQDSIAPPLQYSNPAESDSIRVQPRPETRNPKPNPTGSDYFCHTRRGCGWPISHGWGDVRLGCPGTPGASRFLIRGRRNKLKLELQRTRFQRRCRRWSSSFSLLRKNRDAPRHTLGTFSGLIGGSGKPLLPAKPRLRGCHG